MTRIVRGIVSLALLLTASVAIAGEPIFESRLDFEILPVPEGICAADFDGDNFMDIATYSYDYDSLIILFGSGDGFFEQPVHFDTPGSLYGLTCGDVNEDTHPDILVYTYMEVYLMLNDGSGGFGTPTLIPSTGYPESINLIDLNKDNHLDLLIPNDEYGVTLTTVLLGNGDGTFTLSDQCHCGNSPAGACAGDFNGDTWPDFAAIDYSDDSVFVHTGDGDGTFTLDAVYITGDRPEDVIAADLDGDLDLDLAVLNYGGGSVTVLFNDGSGGFPASITSPTGTAAYYSEDLAAGDIDDDGDIDLIATGSHLAVMYNSGSGVFTPDTSLWAGDDATQLVLADFNNNGRLDIAVAIDDDGGDYGNVAVFLNKGGAFASWTELPSERWLWGNCTGDFDGDNDMDLAVVDYIDDSLLIMLNDGTGSFTTVGRFGTVHRAWEVVCADLDGDNDSDLVVGGSSATGVAVYLNDGSAGFSANGTFATQQYSKSIFVGTLNADAIPDIAVANSWDQSLSILIGNGNGTYQPAVNIPISSRNDDMHGGDFDGDDDIDLVVACYSTDAVTVFANDGTGLAYTATDYAVGEYPQTVRAVDLDGDGDLDLMAGHYYSNDVYVLENDGGTFSTAGIYHTGMEPNTVDAADMDDDGTLDLVVVNEESDDIAILLGEGSLSYGSLIRYGTGPEPFGLCLADFNGDGSIDIATSAYETPAINLLFNIYGTALDIDDPVDQPLPTQFHLAQNYPNPFNPSTTIEYSLPTRSAVRLVIYNILGQEITTLVNAEQAAGTYRVTWNGRDNAGRHSASGIYLYRLIAGDRQIARKMLLVK